MEKPKIKPWIEKDIEAQEKFKVAQPVRLALPGQPARKFAVGEEVTLSGSTKKEFYLRNLVFYPEDFGKVKAYERAQKFQFSGAPEVSKESAEASAAALKRK